MWIAQKTEFVAKTEPYNDVESGNWAEFQAPRGEKGEQGERGDVGLQVQLVTGSTRLAR